MHIDSFIMGIFIGLILMTSLYNLLLYYYNRERYFLYYSLMQMSIIGVLFYDIGVVKSLYSLQTTQSIGYAYVSLFALFFIVLFAQTFLQTKTYLPKHDKILQAIFLLIIADMLYYPLSFIFEYGIYFFIFLYIVYLGYLKAKQGDKASQFYLIGWSLFFLSTLTDFCEEFATSLIACNPMIIGVVAEALMLALALSYKFKELRQKQLQQEELLVQQSKLASMGELLGNIAHQWRQPLARLSYTLMNLEDTQNKEEHAALLKEGSEHLEYMSQTIEDFMHFYAPKKQKESFLLSDAVKECVVFANYSSIETVIELKKDAVIYNYKNELKQVILNLLANANEALLEREIPSPKITLIIERGILSITDNAGGILSEEIEKIFEPYFTTKERGLGIGLYMSKIIIENTMQGRLSIKNIPQGALFIIDLHTSLKNQR